MHKNIQLKNEKYMTSELQEALEYLHSITPEEYKINKEIINKKVFNLLYFQPKFKDQQVLVEEIDKSLINNYDIFLLIKSSWNEIPKLLKDKFYYFIEVSVNKIPFEELFNSDVEIKNFVLRLNFEKSDEFRKLINNDLLITSQLSTLEIYNGNPEWFEKEFLIKESRNPKINKTNRLVVYEILSMHRGYGAEDSK